MINQAIIDYVKAQQDAGVAREQIALDLQREGGWTPEQIEEVFAEVNGVNVWDKLIPWTNWITLAVMLGITVFISAPMGQSLVESSPLPEFAKVIYSLLLAAVLYIVSVVGFFVLLENLFFRYKFKKHKGSHFDGWIVLLIYIRNIAGIVAITPIIQFFALVVIEYLFLPWFVLYVILVIQRFRQPTRRVAAG